MQKDDDKDKKNNKDRLLAYPTGRLTLLELMGALAVLGILLTWVIRRFFM